MDRWAASLPAVAFVCISCAGPALAVAFRDRLGLKHCYNVYVDSEEHMPEWGQLGCSGFIVLNAGLQVVCSATEAFLDVGPERAFRHVESFLNRLLAESESSQEQQQQQQQQGATAGGCASGRCELPVKRRSSRVEPADKSDKASQRPSAAEGVESGSSSGTGDESTSGGHSDSASSCSSLSGIHETGVTAMDAEHQECACALETLRECRSRAALSSALECIRCHFAHEERMLDGTIWAKAAALAQQHGQVAYALDQPDVGPVKFPALPGFAAESDTRKSHFADHARMLRAMEEQLEALPAAADELAAASLNVDPAFVDRIIRLFVSHANMYDASYAGAVDPACTL